MTPEVGERRIKAIQRDFFTYVEQHAIFYELQPDAFNALRKNVIRGSFAAYRAGVLGFTIPSRDLWQYFFGWLEEDSASTLTADSRSEVATKCLFAALDSYRIGVLVSLSRDQ